MYTTSKVKYSQILNSLDYGVQDVPENSSKTSLLSGVSNRPSAPIGRDENSAYFKFLEGQF